MAMIGIVDYDMGNLGSIKNMIKKIGGNSIITNNHQEIRNCSAVILPGVGSFDMGIRNLHKHGLFNLLLDIASEGNIPFLGICLGMQLLGNKSEEGVERGLGLIDADTIRFPENDFLKVPHMGWNFVKGIKQSYLLDGFEEIPRFYFVHSYYVKCNKETDVLAKSTYGIDFHSAFERDNIYGVQFHPEKSHRFGMHLLNGFIKAVKSNAKLA
jgi:glutamine amidotransferase